MGTPVHCRLQVAIIFPKHNYLEYICLKHHRMNKYLITFYLLELDEHFWKLIPEHREIVNELLLKEVIETYGVNMERTKGWITLNAKDEAEAINIIESFPISNYYTYDIDQLFIFENALGLMPKMVFN